MITALKNFFSQHGFEPTYFIAYSGGLDSQVLLHLCYELSLNLALKFRVVHINHQLSPHAKDWAVFCKVYCAELGWQCEEYTLNIEKNSGDSLEEKAREERYAVFASLMQPGDILLTAHHQDDQAETFLLQLTRGAGLKGLASMPTVKAFTQGLHARPLLGFSRALLQAYAEEKKLTWINDESNFNTTFTRNFLRHDILPHLRTRFPAITETLARSAQHCAEAESLLQTFAAPLLENTCGTKPNTLSVSKLNQLNFFQQKLILRMWIEQAGFRLPNEKKLLSIQKNVLLAGIDRNPKVDWNNVGLRRYRDDLYLMPVIDEHEVQKIYLWNLQSELVIPQIGKLKCEKNKGVGLHGEITSVAIQFRRGGEMLHVKGRGKRPLKNLFQEWGVPVWLRNRTPLVYAEGQLIGVVGHFLDENYRVSPAKIGSEIIFVT